MSFVQVTWDYTGNTPHKTSLEYGSCSNTPAADQPKGYMLNYSPADNAFFGWNGKPMDIADGVQNMNSFLALRSYFPYY